jgi:hypothetical protein
MIYKFRLREEPTDFLREFDDYGNGLLARELEPETEFETKLATVRATPQRAAEFDFKWVTDADLPGWYDSEEGNLLESGNPKPAGNIAAKDLLKRMGLKTTTRIDKKTASLIHSVLERSVVLRPFIAAKLEKMTMPKKFVHYQSDPEFDYAYLDLTKMVVPFGSKAEKELINIRGFYHRPTNSIHFRPSANVGQALQMVIGTFSPPAFRNFFGKSLVEGVGLYFANLVLEEQGLMRIESQPYRVQLRCAIDLVGLVGRDLVGKAYFQNHLDLVRHLTTKLSIGPVSTDQVARDALCKTELLLWERFTKQHLGITDQIQFVEVGNISASRSNGRVVMTRLPDITARMSHAKRVSFIKRFIDPMLKHTLSRNTLIELNRRSRGNHIVRIAWANGKFGGNGTVALNRREAVGGRGSGSMIFIDEHSPDLDRLPTLRSNPDVLLFHELVHAFHNQSGTTVSDGAEMEKRVIGIGNHSNLMRTENGYRRAKSLPSRCCPDREQL